MSIAGLTSDEGSANNYVKTYCSHNYPQSATTANLATLMGHSDIASQIGGFSSEVSAASTEGKPHIFGETNSGNSVLVRRVNEYLLTIALATQGGGGISPTFGAALWILDYVMQTLLMGTKVNSVLLGNVRLRRTFTEYSNTYRPFTSTRVLSGTVGRIHHQQAKPSSY